MFTAKNTRLALEPKNDPVIFDMVFVEGGSFRMGSNDGDKDEKPMHTVILNSFYIGKYEVTQKQWSSVMENNPSFFKYCDNCPVEQVSWHDVKEFIRKLNQITANTYRLPTEAEWEYASKGGNKSNGYLYSGSNNVDDVAWHKRNSDSITHPVRQKQSNELGLFDMSGNVREWCSDWYGSDYYSHSLTKNPLGPSCGSSRLLRGGGWNDPARRCRNTYRCGDDPGYRYSDKQESNDVPGYKFLVSRYLGLRLVRDP